MSSRCSQTPGDSILCYRGRLITVVASARIAGQRLGRARWLARRSAAKKRSFRHALVATAALANESAISWPGPSLEGTRWELLLDIGRTTFTLMPLDWAISGSRLELPIAVEFRAGGELAVLGVGDFLGEWLAPREAPSFLQFFPVLNSVLPQGPEAVSKPSITNGGWAMAKDDSSGRLLHFWVETTGFRRGDLWLPRGKLRFRAKAWGALLAEGNDAVVTIRESRAAFGAFFGAFAGMTMGPAAMVACGLAAGLMLDRVPVVVGRWRKIRLDDVKPAEVEDKVFLSPVKLTVDSPSTWQ